MPDEKNPPKRKASLETINYAINEGLTTPEEVKELYGEEYFNKWKAQYNPPTQAGTVTPSTATSSASASQTSAVGEGTPTQPVQETRDYSNAVNQFLGLQAQYTQDVDALYAMEDIFKRHKNGDYLGKTATITISDEKTKKRYEKEGWVEVESGKNKPIFKDPFKNVNEFVMTRNIPTADLQQAAVKREQIIARLIEINNTPQNRVTQELVDENNNLLSEYNNLVDNLMSEHHNLASAFSIQGGEFRYNPKDHSIVTATEYNNISGFDEFAVGDMVVSDVGSKPMGIKMEQLASHDYFGNELLALNNTAQKYYGTHFSNVFTNMVNIGLNNDNKILKEETKVKAVDFAESLLNLAKGNYPDLTAVVAELEKQLSESTNHFDIIQNNQKQIASILNSLSPVHLKFIHDNFQPLLSESKYFNNLDDYSEFVNNGPRHFDNIEQFNELRLEIGKQAATQTYNNYNSQFESLLSDTGDLPMTMASNYALRAFFAEHMYNEDTGEYRTLDELMSVFKDVYSTTYQEGQQQYQQEQQRIQDEDAIFSELVNLKQPETAESTGVSGFMSSQQKEEAANNIIESYLESREVSSKVQRSIKNAQKNISKANKQLDSNLIYIPDYDWEGNVIAYQVEERLENGEVKGRPDLANKINQDPKELKKISKLLEQQEKGLLTIDELTEDFTENLLSESLQQKKGPQALKEEALRSLAYELVTFEEGDISFLSAYSKSRTGTESSEMRSFKQGISDAFKTAIGFLHYKASERSYNASALAQADRDMYEERRFNILGDSDDRTMRPAIYEAYSDVLIDLQKEFSNVSIKGLFPESLVYNQIDIRQFGEAGTAAGGIGMTQYQSIIDKDIIPSSDTPKANNANLIAENLQILLNEGSAHIRKGKSSAVFYNSTFNTRNKEKVNDTYFDFDTAYSNASKVDLEFLPAVGSRDFVGYQFTLYDEDNEPSLFSIYANKETMESLGEKRASTIVDPDKKLLLTRGGYNFANKLDRIDKRFTNNQVAINNEGELIWKVKYKGETKSVNLSEEGFNYQLEIDHIQLLLTTLLQNSEGLNDLFNINE